MNALILSGGGARGAYEAGVIQTLFASKRFDIICGSSIGAINGALAAQGRLEELAALWHSIAGAHVIQYVDQVQRARKLVNDFDALFHDSALRKIGDVLHVVADYLALGPLSGLLGLRGLLRADPIEAMLAGRLDLRSVERTLIITATNLTRGTSDAFYRFIDAQPAAQQAFASKPNATRYPLTPQNFGAVVRASAAIPGAFEPIPIDVGDGAAFAFVDGGVANNTPIGVAIDAGATDVTIVFMDPSERKPREQSVANLAQIAFASYDVMQQKILEDDLKLAVTVNEAIHHGGAKGKRSIALHEIRPSQPLALSILGFDNQPAIDAAFARGVQDAGAAAQAKPISG